MTATQGLPVRYCQGRLAVCLELAVLSFEPSWLLCFSVTDLVSCLVCFCDEKIILVLCYLVLCRLSSFRQLVVDEFCLPICDELCLDLSPVIFWRAVSGRFCGRYASRILKHCSVTSVCVRVLFVRGIGGDLEAVAAYDLRVTWTHLFLLWTRLQAYPRKSWPESEWQLFEGMVFGS